MGVDPQPRHPGKKYRPDRAKRLRERQQMIAKRAARQTNFGRPRSAKGKRSDDRQTE